MDDLHKKLQIKNDQKVAAVNQSQDVDLPFDVVSIESAEVVIVFAQNEKSLKNNMDLIIRTAQNNLLLWVAYPKANQLATDINRDTVREFMQKHHLATVRLVSINNIWSALRLKSDI